MMMAGCLGGTIGVSVYFLLSGLEALLTSKVEPESDPSHDDGRVPRCLCVLLVVWLRGFAHI